jgi:hypothetical protein
MSRTRYEIELSLGEAINISSLQQQYLSDKLADMLRELPSSKIQDILENLEENIYEICSEEPSPNTSKLEYVLEKMEDIVYNICYTKNIIIDYNIIK